MRISDQFVVQLVGTKAVVVDDHTGAEELVDLPNPGLVQEAVAAVVTGELVRIGRIEIGGAAIIARFLYALGYFTGVRR
jgi:hypothetical protein